MAPLCMRLTCSGDFALLYDAVSLLCPGNKHDDGTQSDSENAGAHRRCSKRATLEEHLRRHHSEQKKLQKALAVDKHQDPAVVSPNNLCLHSLMETVPAREGLVPSLRVRESHVRTRLIPRHSQNLQNPSLQQQMPKWFLCLYRLALRTAEGGMVFHMGNC